jgi:hypothetical protein
MRLFFFSLFLLASVFAGARNYYVSSSHGNDANSGDAPANPIRTINAVNEMMLLPGDSVFFRRGDVFRGQLNIRQSGNTTQPIVITAYGTGAPPVIKGSEPIDAAWSVYNRNVYKANVNFKPWFVFVNDQWHTIARSPNKGYFTITKTNSTDPGSKQIGVDELKGKTDVEGAYVSVRTNGWSVVTRKATGFNRETGEIMLDKDRKGDYAGVAPGYESGYGIILSDKLQYLDASREFFYDSLQHVLYLQTYNNASPSGLIEGSVYDYGIRLNGPVKNIVIAGIDFRQQRMAGIFLPDKNERITIDRCSFSNLPDAVMTDCAGSNSSAFLQFSNNTVRDAFKSGVVLGYFSQGKILNNTIAHCGLLVNMAEWMNLSQRCNYSTAAGIAGEGDHSQFVNNRIDSVGHYGMIVGGKNGNDNYVFQNTVSHTCLNYYDCSGIYVNYSEGTILQENVVRDIAVNPAGTPDFVQDAPAILLDFSEKPQKDSVQLLSNILSNCGTGIAISGFVNSLVIRGNTIYNMSMTGIGFMIQNPGTGKIVVPARINSNSFYCFSKSAVAISFVNDRDAQNQQFNFAVPDSNFYFFFSGEGNFRTKCFAKIDERPNVTKWKAKGFDKHGSFITESMLSLVAPPRTGKNLFADSTCSADPKAGGWSCSPMMGTSTVKLSKATDAHFSGTCVKADFTNKSGSTNESVALHLADPENRQQPAAVFAGKNYVLEFDAAATAENEFAVSLQQSDDYSILWSGEKVVIGTTKKTYRILIVPSQNGGDVNLALSGKFGKSFSVFFDNMRFYEVNSAYTSPTQIFPMFANESAQPKNFTLNGSCYVYLDGKSCGEQITVAPYSVVVLRSSCSAPVRAVKGRGH